MRKIVSGFTDYLLFSFCCWVANRGGREIGGGGGKWGDGSLKYFRKISLCFPIVLFPIITARREFRVVFVFHNYSTNKGVVPARYSRVRTGAHPGKKPTLILVLAFVFK